MKSTIRELWETNVSSLYESSKVAKRQAPILHELNESAVSLFARMTIQDKGLLEKMQDLHSDLSAIEAEESFVRGFLLGERLMVEIAFPSK